MLDVKNITEKVKAESELTANLIKEIEEAKSKVEKSVEIASRLIKELKPMCQGIHIMPIGWDKVVPKVLDASGL